MQIDLEFGRGKTDAETTACSVTEVTTQIKNLIEGDLPALWVRGEISGLRPSYSGHYYFTVKDAQCALSCALFAGAARKIKLNLKDGDEVLLFGKVSVYGPRGSYQLIVERAEPVGLGGLAAALEQTRARLAGEGLFDLSRKKALPPHPQRVAIVTSPTGAALQDILNVLGRRNASISVLVVPVLVQGDAAVNQVTTAIRNVNDFQLADLIVVARGGGSLEDLWCFNDERLVRAVAGSELPIVSAVGHETDFTLCDAAADLRAPTPSAAAELISRSGVDLLEQLDQNARRMRAITLSKIAKQRERFLLMEKRLISPADRLMQLQKTLDENALRMENFARRKLQEATSRFDSLIGQMEALSPLKVLGRGYTLIEDTATGEILKSVQQAKAGRKVWLRFKDGKSKAAIS